MPKFKLHDKKGALDTLARLLGMFPNKTGEEGAFKYRAEPSIDPETLTEEQLATILEGYKRAQAMGTIEGEVKALD